MAKKLIILTGYCATGKTTFSLKISKEFNIPCFNKDSIKAVLGRNLEINSRDDSSRLSITAFNMILHILEIFMNLNKTLIIESNFKKQEGEIIDQLLKKHNYQSLTFLLVGDLKIIHKRFIERDYSPERDKANRSNGLFDEYGKFEKAIKPLGDFTIGDKIIKIDTSNFSKINFIDYMKEVEIFIDDK